jgi:hypothetical protein
MRRERTNVIDLEGRRVRDLTDDVAAARRAPAVHVPSQPTWREFERAVADVARVRTQPDSLEFRRAVLRLAVMGIPNERRRRTRRLRILSSSPG